MAADEVCGCPLVQNVFETTGEFCRVQKRKCNKHFSWERLRRAEIDMERVRQVCINHILINVAVPLGKTERSQEPRIVIMIAQGITTVLTLI